LLTTINIEPVVAVVAVELVAEVASDEALPAVSELDFARKMICALVSDTVFDEDVVVSFLLPLEDKYTAPPTPAITTAPVTPPITILVRFVNFFISCSLPIKII
jgi:hypothetical protein